MADCLVAFAVIFLGFCLYGVCCCGGVVYKTCHFRGVVITAYFYLWCGFL